MALTTPDPLQENSQFVQVPTEQEVDDAARTTAEGFQSGSRHQNHPWVTLPGSWVLTADSRQWITGQTDDSEARRVRHANYHTSLEDALTRLLHRTTRASIAREFKDLAEALSRNRVLVVEAAERAAEQISSKRAEALAKRSSL